MSALFENSSHMQLFSMDVIVVGPCHGKNVFRVGLLFGSAYVNTGILQVFGICILPLLIKTTNFMWNIAQHRRNFVAA